MRKRWAARGGKTRFDSKKSTDQAKIFKRHRNSQSPIYLYCPWSDKGWKGKPLYWHLFPPTSLLWRVQTFFIWPKDIHFEASQQDHVLPVCGVHNMHFDKANQILILFICFQTVCQAFLVKSTNCMKVSPTAFPFSNRNRHTCFDRLHVFIHIFISLHIYLCCTIQRSPSVTLIS